MPSDYIIKHWVLNSAGVRKIHICAINDANGECVGTGHAICSPEDKYNAERGREIAQGRAVKNWSGHRGMQRVHFDEILNQRASDALKTLEEIHISPISKYNWNNPLY